MIGGLRTPIAEWASIAGLVITAWVARSVWRIRRQFIARVRLPVLASEIANANSEIAKLIPTAEQNRHEVDTQVGKCRIYLEQVIADGANVGAEVVAAVNSALRLALRHGGHRRLTMPSTWWPRRHPSTKNDLWKIYTELNVAVAALREADARLKIAGE